MRAFACSTKPSATAAYAWRALTWPRRRPGHRFDLPKCQGHGGNAAIYLNGHFCGLFVYFLHFAPKTSERTIDDLYDLAFAHLTMFFIRTPLFTVGRGSASLAQPGGIR